MVKYRHYGVYRTGEAVDKEQEVLTNPVTVLDRWLAMMIDESFSRSRPFTSQSPSLKLLNRNSESYISLHYPSPREERWQGGSIDW